MRRLTKEQIAEMCDRYVAGETSVALGAYYDISANAILGLLKRRGIAIRQPTETSRIYACNEHFFARISTEEQAYWLGFLAADANIDLEKRGVLIKQFSRLCIYSVKMVDDLIQLGVTPRKSHTLQWPSLRYDLLRHYLRGHFDGDGSFTRCNGGRSPVFKLTGNPIFLEGCQAFLMSQCELPRTKWGQRHRGEAIYDIIYVGKEHVRKIAHLLYAGATIWMPRKYQRALELLDDVS